MSNYKQQPSDGSMLPPYSADAEQALVGCLLIDPDSLVSVADVLQPDDFYVHHWALAYECALDLSSRREPVDLITLSQECARRGDATADVRMIEAINYVPTALHIRSYAKTIADLSTRRRMIQAAQKVASLAYQVDGDLDTQMDEAETAVLAARGNLSQGMASPREYIAEYLATIDESRNGGAPVGIATGFTDLDSLLRGLKRKKQYVLAARPGMGKSALAIGLGWRLAGKMSKRVALFSLEMDEKEITDRIVSAETGIDGDRVGDPSSLSDREIGLVYEVAGRVSESRLFIDATPAQSPGQIRAKCLRLYAEHGLDLVIVDHMHLMQPDRRMNNPVLEYGEISQALKDLAKLVNAPVLTLAQLSRGVESRQNKRPSLSDLRESGRIEENADAVMFIYRDDYYDEMSDTPNQAEIIIAKHRGGPTGAVRLYWSGRTTSFRNLKREAIDL